VIQTMRESLEKEKESLLINLRS